MLQVYLYNVTKRNNSFKKPSDYLYYIGGTMREPYDIYSPVFTFTNILDINWTECNYLSVEIEGKTRYYYITDISFSGNLRYIQCKQDTLVTWRDELEEQTFYCTRTNGSAYINHELTDNQFPAGVEPSIYTAEYENPILAYEDGIYIIAIASAGNESERVGSNVYYAVQPDEMKEFFQTLMSTTDFSSITSIADNLIKMYINPLQYVQSVIWLPIKKSALNTEKADAINFGWWCVDCSCYIINVEETSNLYAEKTVKLSTDEVLTMDDNFDNDEGGETYTKYKPYSYYTLYYQPFGAIPLSNEMIKGLYNGNLRATYRIDIITGMALLTIYNNASNNRVLYRTTAQLGVEIPVGEVIQNFQGAITELGGAVTSGGAVSKLGNIASAITDLANPEVRTQGASGGFALLNNDANIKITRTYYKPTIKPLYYGQPCCDNVELKGMIASDSGYSVFDNVEVQGAMTYTEKREIKELLEGGVFCNG